MYKNVERRRLNGIYNWAKTRCSNPNVAQYKDYGGRGIKFLFNSFEEFLEELGPRPNGYSLDRINNDGNYEKGNIRWATREQQNNNKGIYDNSATKVTGISIKNPDKSRGYKNVRYQVRVMQDGVRKQLYVGPDFFEACCKLKSWENNNG